jgi:hypothetical protein
MADGLQAFSARRRSAATRGGMWNAQHEIFKAAMQPVEGGASAAGQVQVYLLG